MTYTFTYPSKIRLDGPTVTTAKRPTKGRNDLSIGIHTSEPFAVRQDLENLIQSGRKLRVTFELLEG